MVRMGTEVDYGITIPDDNDLAAVLRAITQSGGTITPSRSGSAIRISYATASGCIYPHRHLNGMVGMALYGNVQESGRIETSKGLNGLIGKASLLGATQDEIEEVCETLAGSNRQKAPGRALDSSVSSISFTPGKLRILSELGAVPIAGDEATRLLDSGCLRVSRSSLGGGTFAIPTRATDAVVIPRLALTSTVDVRIEGERTIDIIEEFFRREFSPSYVFSYDPKHICAVRTARLSIDLLVEIEDSPADVIIATNTSGTAQIAFQSDSNILVVAMRPSPKATNVNEISAERWDEILIRSLVRYDAESEQHLEWLRARLLSPIRDLDKAVPKWNRLLEQRAALSMS